MTVRTKHMSRLGPHDGLIILPQCEVVQSWKKNVTAECRSFCGCVASDSFCHLPNTMAAFFLPVYGKKKKKEIKEGFANLMHVKAKERESDSLSCTWTCAPDGMVLFVRCILSKAPKSVSYVHEGLLDCSLHASSFHMIVRMSFSDVMTVFFCFLYFCCFSSRSHRI